MIARGIVDNGTYGLLGGGGHGQQDPMHWPPGTPALFALAHAIDPGAVTDDGAVTAAFPWQAAVGTLTIVATFALVVLVAGPAAALLAALLVALYPPLVAASGDLLSEPLGSLLLTAALAATVLTMRRPTRTAGRSRACCSRRPSSPAPTSSSCRSSRSSRSRPSRGRRAPSPPSWSPSSSS